MILDNQKIKNAYNALIYLTLKIIKKLNIKQKNVLFVSRIKLYQLNIVILVIKNVKFAWNQENRHRLILKNV